MLSRDLQPANVSLSDSRISSVSVRELVRVLMVDNGEAPKAPIWRVRKEVNIP